MEDLTADQRAAAMAAAKADFEKELEAAKEESRALAITNAELRGEVKGTTNAMKETAGGKKESRAGSRFLPHILPKWAWLVSEIDIPDPRSPALTIKQLLDDTTFKECLDPTVPITLYQNSEYSAPVDAIEFMLCTGFPIPLTLCVHIVAMGGSIYKMNHQPFSSAPEKFADDVARYNCWIEKDAFLDYSNWESAQLLFRAIISANTAAPEANHSIARLYGMHIDWIRARRTDALWLIFARYDMYVRLRLKDKLRSRSFPHGLGYYQKDLWRTATNDVDYRSDDGNARTNNSPFSRIISLKPEIFERVKWELLQGQKDVVKGGEFYPPAPTTLGATGTPLRATWKNSSAHPSFPNSNAHGYAAAASSSSSVTATNASSANQTSNKKAKTAKAAQAQQQPQQEHAAQQANQQQPAPAQQAQDGGNRQPFRVGLCVGCGRHHADGRHPADCDALFPGIGAASGTTSVGATWKSLYFLSADGTNSRDVVCIQFNQGRCRGGGQGGHLADSPIDARSTRRITPSPPASTKPKPDGSTPVLVPTIPPPSLASDSQPASSLPPNFRFHLPPRPAREVVPPRLLLPAKVESLLRHVQQSPATKLLHPVDGHFGTRRTF